MQELRDSGATTDPQTTSTIDQSMQNSGFARGCPRASSSRRRSPVPSSTPSARSNVALAPMPTDTGTIGLSMAGTNVAAISPKSDHPEVAAKFLNFLINDAEASEILGLTRGIPLNTTNYEALAPTLTGGNKIVNDFVLEYQAAVLRCRAARSGRASAPCPADFTLAYENVIFGQQSNADAATSLYATFTSAIPDRRPSAAPEPAVGPAARKDAHDGHRTGDGGTVPPPYTSASRPRRRRPARHGARRSVGVPVALGDRRGAARPSVRWWHPSCCRSPTTTSSPQPEFIGFDNYQRMFFEDPRFWKVRRRHAELRARRRAAQACDRARHRAAAQPSAARAGVLPLGVLRALAPRRQRGGRDRLAHAVLANDGVVDNTLNVVGLDIGGWISNPSLALYVLVSLAVWQFGAPMVIFLAGLKQVPAELYDAAAVDGAGRWRSFWSVTWPLLSPVLFFNLVLEMIGAFQSFTSAYVVSGGRGGPIDSTLFYTLYLYDRAFTAFDMGYASAMAWFLLVVDRHRDRPHLPQLAQLGPLRRETTDDRHRPARHRPDATATLITGAPVPRRRPRTPARARHPSSGTCSASPAGAAALSRRCGCSAPSFKPGTEILTNPTPIPQQFTLENFEVAFQGVAGLSLWQLLGNSLTISVAHASSATSSAARWPPTRSRGCASGSAAALFAFMISTIMLPMHVVLIPQFIIFNELGMVGTFLPLVLPKFLATEAFFVFLMVQFIRGIPRDLDEAALIDGAGPYRTFWSVILPLMRPALITTTIFSFIWSWDDFFPQLIYLNHPEILHPAAGAASVRRSDERLGVRTHVRDERAGHPAGGHLLRHLPALPRRRRRDVGAEGMTAPQRRPPVASVRRWTRTRTRSAPSRTCSTSASSCSRCPCRS